MCMFDFNLKKKRMKHKSQKFQRLTRKAKNIYKNKSSRTLAKSILYVFKSVRNLKGNDSVLFLFYFFTYSSPNPSLSLSLKCHSSWLFIRNFVVPFYSVFDKPACISVIFLILFVVIICCRVIYFFYFIFRNQKRFLFYFQHANFKF